LTRDGDRAVARIHLPIAPPTGVGPAPGIPAKLSVQMDGQVAQTIALPDLAKLRKDMFGAGERRQRSQNAWLRPRGEQVFSGGGFPKFDYPDPERIRSNFGPYTIETAYYDSHFARVTKPAGPGRYGAVTTVFDAYSDTCTLYQTLYCAPPGEAPATQPAMMLAAQAENPGATRFDAAKADRDWWHALRKKLGTAVRYEYFVRLPRGYDADPQKRWPVIFYLHGSGGGDDPRVARTDGPQSFAAAHADFPFIVVSLRTPAGWLAPAVEDVIDEVAATMRTDPARYYLTGFSMGGVGTWSVAQDRPERFAAIAAIAGEHGDLDRAATIKGPPAWVINGAEDTVAIPADALKMVEALKAAGGEVKWTRVPGAAHGDSYAIAYQWDELYAWFLAHHR
jgi:poly(3-hydroxybutyrate) depolymerase